MQMHRHRGCRRFADADDRDIGRVDDRQLDLRQHPPKRQRSQKPGAPAADHHRAANRLRHLIAHPFAASATAFAIVNDGDAHEGP